MTSLHRQDIILREFTIDQILLSVLYCLHGEGDLVALLQSLLGSTYNKRVASVW
jgi:hypothetical protein